MSTSLCVLFPVLLWCLILCFLFISRNRNRYLTCMLMSSLCSVFILPAFAARLSPQLLRVSLCSLGCFTSSCSLIVFSKFIWYFVFFSFCCCSLSFLFLAFWLVGFPALLCSGLFWYFVAQFYPAQSVIFCFPIGGIFFVEKDYHPELCLWVVYLVPLFVWAQSER